MTRVIIADDHEVIRLCLRKTIERKPDWRVCAEASDGLEAVTVVQRDRPDILVLDLSMSKLNGLEVTFRIHRLLPKTQILIFSMHNSEDMVRQALMAGAQGFILKSASLLHVELALEALSRHQTYFDPEISEIVLRTVLSTSEAAGKESFWPECLTVREREILQLLAEGTTNKQIATVLGLSVATVRTHRTAMMRKLKSDSIAKLVRYAVRNKVIEP